MVHEQEDRRGCQGVKLRAIGWELLGAMLGLGPGAHTCGAVMVGEVGQTDQPRRGWCGVEHRVEMHCEQGQLNEAVGVAVKRGRLDGHDGVRFGARAGNVEGSAVGEVVEPGAGVAA